MTPTPSRLGEERLREIERENVCLIPREGSRNPIVCHEKATLCAHEVSQMARELREARERERKACAEIREDLRLLVSYFAEEMGNKEDADVARTAQAAVERVLVKHFGAAP